MDRAALLTALPMMSGQDGHNTQIDGAKQRDLIEDLLDEVCGGLAGPEARDEAAVFLQVVGDLNGVELDGGIEIAEADDHHEVEDHIQHGLGIDGVQEAIPEGALRQAACRKRRWWRGSWRWTGQR